MTMRVHVAAGVIAVLATGAVVYGASDEHVTFFQLVAGSAFAVVTATVATMTWIDKRMDSKVAAMEARLLAQINLLQELLAQRDVIRLPKEERRHVGVRGRHGEND